MRKALIAIAVTVSLSGCTLGPDYQAPEYELPDNWPVDVEAVNEQHIDWQNWWTRFNDPVLNDLVARALDSNLELSLQVHRIEQARAQLGLADANRWPLLSAQADAAREQQPAVMLPEALGGGTPRNQLSVAGVLSYEVDLWGRLAREREVALAQLDQSVFGSQAIRLNLITDVVTTYINLRAAEQQYAIAQQTAESRQQTLELEQFRSESGATNPLSLRRAQASFEAARALLPDLRQQVIVNRSALAILVGFTPAELLQELDFGNSLLSDIDLPDDIPARLPSELLQRRPDVRAAESYLMATNAQIGVAMANRWPSLNLNAMFGTAASETSNLFTQASQTWSLGAGLAAPILDFGRGRAGVMSAEALAAQARIEYEMAVTSAFRDARDALTLYQNAEERVTAIRRQVEAVREARELAGMQHESGAIGFYELLDIERELLNAQLTLSNALSSRLVASAALFRAMGGGWNADP